MNMKIIIRAALVVLLGGYAVQADTVWTSGHHDIVDGELYGEIYIYNDVTVDIFGGQIYRLETYDVTLTNWYDGEMIALWILGDSTVNIYGGSLERFDPRENAVLNLYAYDVIHHATGGYWGRGWLEGKYISDDSSFSFDLYDLDSLSHINVVPEPSILSLLCLGALFLRKKR